MYFQSLAALALSLAFTALAQTASPAPEFQTLDRHKANLVRFDPTVDWRRYTQIQLAPAVEQPCAPAICLKSGDAAKLNAAIDSSLRSAFRHLPGRPGDVLLIRPVVTAVRPTDTFFNVVSFALIQMPLSYGAAAVKYELVDAASGRLVGEIASERCAGPWNLPPWEVFESFRPLGQSTVLLKDDSRRLRNDVKRLSRLGANPPAAATPLAATEQ